MDKKRKKLILYFIAAICAGYIVFYFVGKTNRARVYDTVKEQAYSITLESSEESYENSKEYNETSKENNEVYGENYESSTQELLEIPIDFGSLQLKYPDLYAWIEIPDNKVSYPIMQSQTDNSYYLNYNIDGVKGYPGSIYTENLNNKDFSDFNTVIYGHDMKDGSMFGTLKKYKNREYFDSHRDIIIYTPNHIRQYKVFAAVTYDDRHILNSFDMTKATGRQSYLNTIWNLNGNTDKISDDVEVNTDSHIITLSTCIASQPSNRFLIEAVLIYEQ